MSGNLRKRFVVGSGLVLILLATGCTNWEQKYQECEEARGVMAATIEDLKGDLALASAEAEKCQQALLSKKNEIESLRANQGVSDSTYQDALSQVRDLEAKLAECKEGKAGDVWTQAAGFAMTELPVAVLFDSGSAKIKASGSRALSSIVADLNGRFGSKNIMVLGHTDNDAIQKSGKLWKDNWDLSCGRALAVVRHLVSQGVSAPRVAAAGAGKNRPVAANTTKAGKAKNRRIEIYVYDQSAAE